MDRRLVTVLALLFVGCARPSSPPPPPPAPVMAPEPGPTAAMEPPPRQSARPPATANGDDIITTGARVPRFPSPRPPASAKPSTLATETAPAPRVPCDVTDDDQTPADCAAYRNARRKLADGAAAVNVPPTMRVGATVPIRLAISRDLALTFPADEVARLPGTKAAFGLKVSRFMVAQLSGNGFVVTPAGPVRKDTVVDDNAVWDWTVKAVEAGDNHILTLRTWVEVKLPDGTLQPREVRDKDYPIAITVAPGQALLAGADAATDAGGHLVKLLEMAAAVLAAIGAVVLAARKLLGRKDAAKH